MHTLDGGRIGIAAQALGLAEGALQATIDYVKRKKTVRSFDCTVPEYTVPAC